MNRSRGFTLVELLVVIVIIVLLSSIVAPRLVGMNAHARNGERIASVKQFQIALESFFDRYSRYPSTGEALAVSKAVPNCSGVTFANTTDLQTLLDDGLLDRLPDDPKDNMCFKYADAYSCDTGIGGGTTYAVLFQIEGTATEDIEDIPGLKVDPVDSSWYCLEG